MSFHIPWSQGVCYMGSQQVGTVLQATYEIILMANQQKHTG